jgi:hypothetical protein
MTQVEFQQILEMINRSRSSLKEKLKGDQHKIDMNKNGKIDAEDFMHLRKKKPRMEESELDEGSKHAARPRSASRPGTEPAKKGSLQDRIMAARERIDAKKKDMKEEVEDVAEASKKIPASNKPVKPEDLYVSLKDIPAKKPRGHTQYDPAKEFPGIKAFKKQGVSEEVEDVAEGLSDIVKGIKRKVAGKDNPKDVEHTYARIARRDIEDANKLNNQAAYDARDKSTKRWEKINKVVNKQGVAEASKKIPASNKPVDPKDLLVSLKDVPVKKPRGHTQYDPAKEFPGIKAFKKQGVSEEAEHNYTVKHTHSVKEPGELDSSTKRHHYDIHKDGKKVGELEHGEYFGDVNGKLHGKDLPPLGSYRGSHPEAKLHSFMNSNTGTKWASNLHKYQKEEAEQIDEISMDYLRKKDYMHKAEVSRKDAENTTRQYWKSPEEKQKARETVNKRDKGIGAYTDRLYKTMKKPEYKSNNPMNSYPLGGRDEKSGRSYSE